MPLYRNEQLYKRNYVVPYQIEKLWEFWFCARSILCVVWTFLWVLPALLVMYVSIHRCLVCIWLAIKQKIVYRVWRFLVSRIVGSESFSNFMFESELRAAGIQNVKGDLCRRRKVRMSFWRLEKTSKIMRGLRVPAWPALKSSLIIEQSLLDPLSQKQDFNMSPAKRSLWILHEMKQKNSNCQVEPSLNLFMWIASISKISWQFNDSRVSDGKLI